MANIKTPDGGFYVNDTEFNVDYVNNIVTLANGGGGQGSNYLSLDGGTMNANAVIEGTDNLQVSVGDTDESAGIGVTQNGVIIAHNTNSEADSSIKVFDNTIAIEAKNGILLSNKSNGYSGIIVDTTGMGISRLSTFSDSDIHSVIVATPIENAEDNAIVIGNNYDESSFDPDSGGGITITGNNTISIISPQPINFNNNRLTGVANPTNDNDAVNLTYFENNLPQKATYSRPGLVKQVLSIISLPEQASLAEVITAFNQLLGGLHDAGIMASLE